MSNVSFMIIVSDEFLVVLNVLDIVVKYLFVKFVYVVDLLLWLFIVRGVL